MKLTRASDLSSKSSQLGVDARNAAQLYINEVNDTGGINGHPVELVVKDDGSDKNKAVLAHNDFNDEGVNYVIGHLTSDMAQTII